MGRGGAEGTGRVLEGERGGGDDVGGWEGIIMVWDGYAVEKVNGGLIEIHSRAHCLFRT